MKRRSFSGDEKYRLPKGKREPYRLWFEYLKLACDYPGISVDQMIYKDWDDVANADFDDWWEDHWRRLFATQPQSRQINSTDEFEQALKDPHCIVLRVSITSSRKERLKDIDLAVKANPVSQMRTRARDADPAFAISSKRSINYATLRGMLRYLKFYKENEFDIDKATLAYHKWSSDWNDRVKQQNLRQNKVYVPPFLPDLVIEIGNKATTGKQRTRAEKRAYDELRNRARRMLRRGQSVLKNVAKGKFPGSF